MNVFCITETWLSEFISDCEIIPSDFVLYRKDRPSRGGGVLIAINKSLYSTLVPSPSDIEVVTIKIGLSNAIVICCVYVPPDSTIVYVSSLVSYLTDIVSSFDKCILVGDFNFPDIDWSSLTGNSVSSNCFCEFVFDCNLTQHVMGATHVKGNILDLIITSPNIVIDEVTILSSHFSDHFIVSFIPLCSTSSVGKSTPGYAFDFTKADFNGMCSFLI